MASGPAFTTGTFVWALGAIAQLHRLPFAPDLVLQQFPPPYNADSVVQAAASIGMKSGVRAVPASALHTLAPPFIAILKLQPADRERGRAVRIAVVLDCTEAKVLYLEEQSEAPVAAPLAAFGDVYAGAVILCAAEAPQRPEADEAARETREFGFRWFVPELLKHKPVWRDVLLASLALQLVGLAAPLCTQVIIDKVVVHQTLSTLTVIAIALGMFLVFNAVMTWVRQYLVLHTGNRVDAVLGTRVFGHLFALPLRYFEHRPTGVLVARLHGVETIREFVSGAAVTLLLDLPFLAIFLAIMFYYSPLLSVITLGILGAIVALSLALVPLMRERLNQQFLLGARNSAFVTEYVAGIETVKSLQMEPQLRGRFGGLLASYLRSTFKTRQLANTYSATAGALEQALAFSVLLVGAWLVMQNAGFTVGMLVAYQMFAGRLSQPVMRLVGLWQEFQQAAIAVKRLGDIMDASPEPYSLVPSRSAATATTIEATDLSFRYDEHQPFLYEHLDFRIEAGACVALTGRSGCGKSTLAKLMQGFYVPTHGRIRIGERDTQTLSANELRQHFGVVPQETTLFSGTIYDNLVAANPHATFEQVVQACRMADIHAAIEQLPHGYQTEIGERGVGLSGGQKQRIAIARALLKRPKILVFDEATSSLDHETAEQVARTISQLKGRVTIIFIAHQVPRALLVDATIALDTMSAKGETHAHLS